MPKPESPLRVGDKMKATIQKKPHSKPHWSVVVRLLDDEGNEHPPQVALVDNPAQWARERRHEKDNPYIPPVEVIE